MLPVGHEEFVELQKSFSRLEGKLDAILPAFEKSVVDHETRIRDLERFKWKQIGFGASAGAIAGFFVKIGVLPS